MDKQKEPNSGDSSRALTTGHNEPYNGLTAINLFDEKQIANAEIFLKRFMGSEKGGIKSIADGLAILARAQDLQLPFTTCIEHIHVINGKTGIDVHIIKSLLSRAGIVWKCTKDYVPQYQYTDGNTIYLETQLPQYCVKCRTPKEAIEATTDDVVGIYPVQWYTDLKGNEYNEFEGEILAKERLLFKYNDLVSKICAEIIANMERDLSQLKNFKMFGRIRKGNYNYVSK